MSKVLMLRPGPALGDAIFVTPIPRVLSGMGHKVDVACEDSVWPVFSGNPHIARHITVPPAHEWPTWEPIYKKLVKKYAHIYHAHGHVEVGYLHRTDVIWGSIPTAIQRREKAAGISYQDAIFEALELPDRGLLPEFYFSQEEKKQDETLRDLLKKDGKRMVLWQWNGSTQSKDMVHGPRYLKETLEHYPDTIHYVYTNSPNLKAQIPKNPNVFDAMGTQTIRQSMQLCQVADLVIGPESFLTNAAAAFDTPKIIFYSHSAPVNLAKYYKNHQAVTPLPGVTCHPCYLIQINFMRVYDPLKRGVCREFEGNCRVWDAGFPYRSLGYKCCFHLDHDAVMAKIGRALG